MTSYSGGVHIGYECKSCGTRIVAYVHIGGKEPICPNCQRPMSPITGADAPEMLTNFVCPVCGSTFVAVVSTGPINKCPNCGASIS